MASFNAAHREALDVVTRQRQRQELLGLSAYDRHKRFVDGLVKHYGAKLPESAPNFLQSGIPSNFKSDQDTLKETYRFIRTDDDDTDGSWEVNLAKRYYSRLFREYAIADLSRYKESRVGLRWRTQKEVISGKGQFVCGSIGCEEREGLSSYEVPFGYVEAGVRKRALVKVRLCREHAQQLNYKKPPSKDTADSTGLPSPKSKRSHNDHNDLSIKRKKNLEGSFIGEEDKEEKKSEKKAGEVGVFARGKDHTRVEDNELSDNDVIQGLFP